MRQVKNMVGIEEIAFRIRSACNELYTCVCVCNMYLCCVCVRVLCVCVCFHIHTYIQVKNMVGIEEIASRILAARNEACPSALKKTKT
jgi:hypothetical protein